MKKMMLTVLFLAPMCVFAQLEIKGKVTDLNGHALDAVTVTLSKDGKNIGSAFADLGTFTLKLPVAGNYILTAQLIGFKPVSRTLTLPLDTVKIIMSPDERQLKEVMISGSKPIIERKNDRVVFNVENSIVGSGGTAWDALTKAPGVQAGFDGTVTAGKKEAQIYLDGKPLHISGDDLTGYLQGLPSDLIARIEVFSNPPAMFDAQGAAVINIITKKSKAQGLNITLNSGYTQATYGSYTGGTSFNYRKDRLNVYGNYGYSDRNRTKDQNDYMIFSTPTDISYWNSPGHTIYRSKTSTYKIGADYQLSSNQVVGFVMTGSNRTGTTSSSALTTVTDNLSHNTDSLLQTNGQIKNHGNRYTYNLNYNIKLDTGGRSFNIDLDYAPFRSTSDQSVSNVSTLPDGTLASPAYHILTPSVQDLNIYSAKLDYNYKAGRIWTLTSGLKYSSIQTKDQFQYYDNSGAAPLLVSDRSDDFSYTENTAAAYTSISGNIGRWTVQGGIRGEFTATRGFSHTLDSLHTDDYFKIFPTLFATYKLDEDNSFSFTYGYRIQRPEYSRLNPLKVYKTPYNILSGNPALKPAFVQNLELGYTFDKEYSVTAYYTGINDRYSNATVQDNVNKLFYDTQENIGKTFNTGLRFFVPLHLTPWWEVSNTAEAYYQQDNLSYLQGKVDYSKFAYDVNSNQSFTLNRKAGLKAEISALYYSDASEGIFRGGRYSEVDAGLRLNVLHSQGSLKLAAGDIFYDYTSRYRVSYLGQDNGFFQKNDSRNLTLSFSYRFGSNLAEARKRSTASEEEKRRAQ